MISHAFCRFFNWHLLRLTHSGQSHNHPKVRIVPENGHRTKVPVSTKGQDRCGPGDRSECQLPIQSAHLFDIETPVSDLLGFQEWLKTVGAA